MALQEQMSGFFDELTKIVDEQKAQRDQQMRMGDRPYSSLLTQDEEPTNYYNPAPVEETEPEVVTRGD